MQQQSQDRDCNENPRHACARFQIPYVNRIKVTPAKTNVFSKVGHQLDVSRAASPKINGLLLLHPSIFGFTDNYSNVNDAL
jgi:hypothetical protein